MKRKSISVILCVAMVVRLAAGCGSSRMRRKTEKKSCLYGFRPWMMRRRKIMCHYWTNLRKENNCELDVQIIPWDTYEEKYMTAINAGEGPDVGYMYVEMFPTYIDSGAVVDMEEYLTEEDYEEYLYLDRGKMMGGTYGFPFNTGNPFIMYYNEDILESIGETAPETWEDFERICKKATKDTRWRR